MIPDKKPAKQVFLEESDDDEDDDSTCWPSKTGMRRGNPKEDYNKDGTPRQSNLPRAQQSSSDKKRKPSNELDGTFWNRSAASKRRANTTSDALMVHTQSPEPHDLIVDTGASHVLFQERHKDLLTNVQLSCPHKAPYAILRAATGQTLTAIGKGIFQIKHVSVVSLAA